MSYQKFSAKHWVGGRNLSPSYSGIKNYRAALKERERKSQGTSIKKRSSVWNPSWNAVGTVFSRNAEGWEEWVQGTDRQGKQKLSDLFNASGDTELSYLWHWSPKEVHISPLGRGKKAGLGGWGGSDSWKRNTEPALRAPAGDLNSYHSWEGEAPSKEIDNRLVNSKAQTRRGALSVLLSCAAAIVPGSWVLVGATLAGDELRVKMHTSEMTGSPTSPQTRLTQNRSPRPIWRTDPDRF